MASAAIILAVFVISLIAIGAVQTGALSKFILNQPTSSSSNSANSSSTASTSNSVPNSFALTVYSAYGNPSPSVGDNEFYGGASVECSVSSPVTVSGVTYTCSGWTGTGSVPSVGRGTDVIVTVTEASTITWDWQTGNSSLGSIGITPRQQTGPWTLVVVSNHGMPVPTGSSQYNDGTLLTCRVSSPIVENGVTWACSGWTGTGSVPSSGATNTATFEIYQDSSITWNWQQSTIPVGSGSPPSSSTPTISQQVIVGNGETTITYSVANVVGMEAWQIAIYCPQCAAFETASFTVGTFPSNAFTVAQPINGYPTETWIAALYMPDGTTWSGSSSLVTVTFATPTPSTFLIQLQYTKLVTAQNTLIPYSIDPSITIP